MENRSQDVIVQVV